MQANVLIGVCSVMLKDHFPPPYDTEVVYKGIGLFFTFSPSSVFYSFVSYISFLDFVLDSVKGESTTGKLHVRVYFYPEAVTEALSPLFSLPLFYIYVLFFFS